MAGSFATTAFQTLHVPNLQAFQIGVTKSNLHI